MGYTYCLNSSSIQRLKRSYFNFLASMFKNTTIVNFNLPEVFACINLISVLGIQTFLVKVNVYTPKRLFFWVVKYNYNPPFSIGYCNHIYVYMYNPGRGMVKKRFSIFMSNLFDFCDKRDVRALPLIFSRFFFLLDTPHHIISL